MLPRAARVYIAGVVTAGLIPLVVAALDWQSQNLARFISYLALATLASTLKTPRREPPCLNFFLGEGGYSFSQAPPNYHGTSMLASSWVIQ